MSQGQGQVSLLMTTGHTSIVSNIKHLVLFNAQTTILSSCLTMPLVYQCLCLNVLDAVLCW